MPRNAQQQSETYARDTTSIRCNLKLSTKLMDDMFLA